MNEEVFAAFAELKARNPVAKKTDRVFEIENPRRWFTTALEYAEIAKFRWHDCRHTFCSRLAMRGVNLKVIQTLAGHKTITMTARYAHLDDASLRVAVNSLAAPSIAASK
jgi:site-specific recombinase XerD